MKLGRTHIIGLVVLLLVLFFFLPIRLPYTLRTLGKIIPSQEWILQKTQDGSLIAVLADNKNGLIQNYSVIQIERGDATRFQLSPDLNHKSSVAEQDTIGSIHSYEILRQLTALEGELAVATASLVTQAVGEKEAVIQEAQQQVALTRERAQLKQRLFHRQDSLYRQNMISQEEFELAESEANVAEIEANIAKLQLQRVTTGVKPEAIEMIEAQVRSLENDIQVRKSQMKAFTLQTPIAGTLIRYYSSDTLLSVCDTSFLIVMPIKWKYRSQLQPGHTIIFRDVDSKKRLSAKILRIQRDVKILNQDQVFLAVGSMEDAPGSYYPNLVVPCTIRGESIALYQYVFRMIKTMFIS
jgi:hypothetical protein